MKDYKVWERLLGLIEYVLAFMFIRGGIVVLFNAESRVLPGFLSYLVGDIAIYVYGAWFIVVGLILVMSKLMKDDRLHKFSLLAIFLTTVYVLTLAIALNGVGLWMIRTVTICLVSGALWLRWKFKTEYLDAKQFEQAVSELRSATD